MNDNPGILKMIRAPFLSSIIAPIVIGTLWSAGVKESFDVLNFIVVLLIGVGLHVATNVYNDIYDTLQGTDKVNEHRNESSGGSGVLLDHPELMGKMYFLARTGLVVAFGGTIALTFLINKELRVLLWVLFLVSAFFSKYYTAPPAKLAYRGWGEVSVWLAFGPMAILIAAVSQNMVFHSQLPWLLPTTGLSTSSILLVGQMIDLEADRKGGKHGVASRRGTRFTSVLYVVVQLALAINILLLFTQYPGNTWPLLLSLLPYILLFPKAAGIIWKHHADPDQLKAGAKLTVLIHLVFSVTMIIGFVLYNFLN
ncbi:prenyltransferase [uncultured Draconibacterium sp.]|uniref:prenyltransferase n=1 Tax=uncultured Draconibacterium sp. TaxID=1573823 RepID=UPI0025E0C5A0|nr:prenyltransferase [uncultured Draconibacterium sp.]